MPRLSARQQQPGTPAPPRHYTRKAMKTKNRLEINWNQTATWVPTIVGLAFMAACAAPVLAEGIDNRAPDVPAALVVGDTNKVHFHGFGVGVQIYTWNGSSWGSAVPEATLFDDDGNIVALH